MAGRRLVTLLTDFGSDDPYVGILKGVIARIDPRIRTVDISHGIPPQDIRKGSLSLALAVPFFPRETVHCAVVDPGVGGSRRCIAIRIREGFLVGPDNGIFSDVIRGSPALAAAELSESRFWGTPAPSNTFHGRDILAPVAAHLARGTRLEHLGRPVPTESLVFLEEEPLRIEGNTCRGRIRYADHFGNLISNVPCGFVAGNEWIGIIGGRRLPAAKTYGDHPPGAVVCLIGSHGFVEVAVVMGNAHRILGLGPGTEITVELMKA